MFCSHCGNQHNDEAVFCSKCGTKVRGGAYQTRDPEAQADPDRVELFLMNNRHYFLGWQMRTIRRQLLGLSERRFMMVTAVDLKDPTVSIFLSVFLGTIGVDRFFIGDIGMGLFKLFTLGLCGILYIIDLFRIMDRTKEINYEEVMRRCRMSRVRTMDD